MCDALAAVALPTLWARSHMSPLDSWVSWSRPTTASTSCAMVVGSRTALVVACPTVPPGRRTRSSPVWNAAVTAAALPANETRRWLAETPVTERRSAASCWRTARTVAGRGPKRAANCPRAR